MRFATFVAVVALRNTGLLTVADLQNCRGCRCGGCCGGTRRRSPRRSCRSGGRRRCWRGNRGCSRSPQWRTASL